MFKLSPFTYTYSNQSKKIFLENPLTFNKNETIVITGPSGGGKSTFLKVLKGIIPEYSSGVFEGEITFDGHPLTGEFFQSNLKRILYLFQNPFSQLIYPTTEEEFLFSMENFNYSKEEMTHEKEKFEKLFGLKNIWGKKTSELSNGECQKLVLASLLAINPDVLLLDEPTAFLDPEARREFYQFLNVIKGDRLLIIVDHHVDEITPLISRTIEVDINGRISESKTAKIEQLTIDSADISDLTKYSDLKLSLNDVSFSYDKNESLLKNITATFVGNEVIAIKGRNGVGKSTLLKLIAGIEKAQTGQVEFIGEKKKFLNRKIFSNVGFIFQNPESHFFFDTIEEELKQSFKHLKSNELKEDLLKRFFHNIDLKRSPFLLSEGEKRRLSILMTVFLEKSLLLYDEPTFGQDPQSIEQIISLIKELKKNGLIQILVSHDDQFISKVADRVFSLDERGFNEIS